MNFDLLPSLEEYLKMSFKSSDDGDKEEAERYFNLYIEARDSAFEVAQQAAIKGDVESLDKIINSINSAKDLQMKEVT